MAAGMHLWAHSGAGHGWGGFVEPWEFHAALVHFPIAFLLGAVALDLYAWWRGEPGLERAATGLLAAGFLTGVAAALAGVLSFFTVPGHTEEAHRLLYWHLGVQSASLALFAWPAWARWRAWEERPALPARAAAWVAAALLLAGSAIGGYLVYHGGMGVAPGLLAPGLRGGHDHGGDGGGGQP